MYESNLGISPISGWVFGKGGLFYKLPKMKGRGFIEKNENDEYIYRSDPNKQIDLTGNINELGWYDIPDNKIKGLREDIRLKGEIDTVDYPLISNAFEERKKRRNIIKQSRQTFKDNVKEEEKEEGVEEEKEEEKKKEVEYEVKFDENNYIDTQTILNLPLKDYISGPDLDRPKLFEFLMVNKLNDINEYGEENKYVNNDNELKEQPDDKKSEGKYNSIVKSPFDTDPLKPTRSFFIYDSSNDENEGEHKNYDIFVNEPFSKGMMDNINYYKEQISKSNDPDEINDLEEMIKTLEEDIDGLQFVEIQVAKFEGSTSLYNYRPYFIMDDGKLKLYNIYQNNMDGDCIYSRPVNRHYNKNLTIYTNTRDDGVYYWNPLEDPEIIKTRLDENHKIYEHISKDIILYDIKFPKKWKRKVKNKIIYRVPFRRFKKLRYLKK
jgi:hypothetical protein